MGRGLIDKPFFQNYIMDIDQAACYVHQLRLNDSQSRSERINKRWIGFGIFGISGLFQMPGMPGISWMTRVVGRPLIYC